MDFRKAIIKAVVMQIFTAVPVIRGKSGAPCVDQIPYPSIPMFSTIRIFRIRVERNILDKGDAV